MLCFGLFLFLTIYSEALLVEGREQCVPGEFPSQVCILYIRNEQLCGGSIIHAEHVLTASYCFKDSLERRHLTKKFVLAGDLTWGHVLTDTRQVREITHLIQHPGYYREGFDLDDIAILRVNTSFSEDGYVAVIPLTITAPEIGEECVVLGWGQAGLQRKTNSLRKGFVYIQRQIKCGGVLVEDTDRLICAANSDTSNTPCKSDPGGPLICNGELAGVHTRGHRECDNRTYGGYFMNVAFYQPWINLVIDWNGEGLEPNPRATYFDGRTDSGIEKLHSSNKFIYIVIIILSIKIVK